MGFTVGIGLFSDEDDNKDYIPLITQANEMQEELKVLDYDLMADLDDEKDNSKWLL